MMGKKGEPHPRLSPNKYKDWRNMLPEVEQEIQRYTQSIFMGQMPELPDVCPHCKNKPDEFKLHEHRQRKFLVVVGGMVKAMLTWLVRFKCGLCKKTFTVYPDFALPYKRYALPLMAGLSEKYVDSDEGYLQCCREGLHRIGYPDGRLLAETTIWRWVGYIGDMRHTLSRALEMLQQKLPGTHAFRKIRDVLCGKYRSENRKNILNVAWQLLNIRPEYEQIFGRPIFPRFAKLG